jgi:hypothetical protein
MAAVGVISDGMGNKIWMTITYIYKFKHSNNKMLYILNKKSKHEQGNKSERIEEIFPKLKKLKWLKFIYDWKEYDMVKQDATIYEKSYDFDPVVFDMPLTNFTMNPDYKPLLKKYDTKNGIILHYRLGDKLTNPNYVIMKPEYFKKYVEKMLQEKEGPVYLASDSMSKAVKLLGFPVIPVEEDAVSTFYLLTKFHRLILSESTFGIVATYLNSVDHHAVIPEYKRSWADQKLKKSPLLLEGAFELETDHSFAKKRN